LSRLSEDEAKAVMGFTAEHPYPLYKWLNAWLMGDRRDKMVTFIAFVFMLMCVDSIISHMSLCIYFLMCDTIR
jgi:hypothetical protein